MPIEIISKRDGFRRCGIPHSIAPVVYPDDRWTPEELQRLKEEPMLMVRSVPEAKEDEDNTVLNVLKPRKGKK